jgi:hypothetical protein
MAAGSGVAAHWNSIRLCEPSQNGRFSLAPQRHSDTAGLPVRSHCLPSASLNTIVPSTRNGPLGRTVILTGSDMKTLTPKGYGPPEIRLGSLWL